MRESMRERERGRIVENKQQCENNVKTWEMSEPFRRGKESERMRDKGTKQRADTGSSGSWQERERASERDRERQREREISSEI